MIRKIKLCQFAATNFLLIKIPSVYGFLLEAGLLAGSPLARSASLRIELREL